MRNSKLSESERKAQKDRGIAYVLLSRLNEQRLPVALELKKKVDRGERLTAYDHSYLKQIMKEAGDVRRFVLKHPEYESLTNQVTELYNEITRKGMENEQKPPPPSDQHS